jgi:hypothetical protein
MKNIHILPTDQPSRLIKNNNNQLILTIQTLPKDVEISCYPQHLYITSNEEIKEGYYLFNNCYYKYPSTLGEPPIGSKKIILTTDQSLDSVQAIDDKFLEWFVKNPTCEKVDVENNKCLVKRGNCDCSERDIDCQCLGYEIIIPKEEPKQETLELPKEIDFANEIEQISEYDKGRWYGRIEGDEWQQERSYSKEEVISFGEFIFKHTLLAHSKGVKNLFEQFKKK